MRVLIKMQYYYKYTSTYFTLTYRSSAYGTYIAY